MQVEATTNLGSLIFGFVLSLELHILVEEFICIVITKDAMVAAFIMVHYVRFIYDFATHLYFTFLKN